MLVETVKKILDRWNGGDKEGARKLFFMSQLLLPEKTRDFLKVKLRFEIKKIDNLAKKACDIMGGKIIDENGLVVYEKNPTKIKE